MLLCGDAGTDLTGRGWALPSLAAAPPQKKEEAWVRTPLTDPVRQIEWRAQNRPTMLPCALRRVSIPFAPRALRRSIQIPAQFSPRALTSSLSLLPHSYARGEGERVLDVRVLVEK